MQEEAEASQNLLQNLSDNLNAILYSRYNLSNKDDALKSRSLGVNWKDVTAWDVKNARAAKFRIVNPSFVPLKEFIEEATELVRPWEEPDKEWPIYGVNNKEGVFFNYYQKGKDFNAAYKRIHKDWFFHNPTRSVVGSLGIVPDVPKEALTSPEYQVWRIKQGLLPGYVAVLITTPFFINLIRIHRVGGVKQRLYVDNLLQISVPVISDKEQQDIAEAREEILARIAETQRKVILLEDEVEDLILGKKKLTLLPNE